MDYKAERDGVIVKFLFFRMIHFLLSSDETHKFMYNDVRSSERVYIGKEKKE